MKKLIPFLGLLLVNNSFASGGEFLAIFVFSFILFHICYSATTTYMSPKDKKLNTFMWAFFIPPILWIILFYLARWITLFIGSSGATYSMFAIIVLIIPIGLYYVMKHNNFFNTVQK